MSELSLRDRELVALGAALAANCVPCVQYHILKAREAGPSDAGLAEVLALADKVRQVPARLVLESANKVIHGSDETTPASMTSECADMMKQMSKGNSCG
jgi:4-carboxymuconolactone decarboxylase